MKQRLNITFPKSWNSCTAEQLEFIAAVTREQTERVDRYHPFDMMAVKLAMFFTFGKFKVEETPSVPVADMTATELQTAAYLVSHPDIEGVFELPLASISYWLNGVDGIKRWEAIMRQAEEAKKVSPKRKNDRAHQPKKPAPLPKKEVAGVFDWMDDPQAQGLTLCPYETFNTKAGILAGPAPLLDGFSWQRYRYCNDYMQFYLSENNKFVTLQYRYAQFVNDKYRQDQIREAYNDMRSARANFLACLLCPKDEEWTTAMIERLTPALIDFDDDKWQVLLFFWSGCMHYLHKEYPHCFKTQEVKGAPANPLQLYTRTVATIEKYLGLNEKEVNAESFHNVFQHLENMAKENEQLEKLRSKNHKR